MRRLAYLAPTTAVFAISFALGCTPAGDESEDTGNQVSNSQGGDDGSSGTAGEDGLPDTGGVGDDGATGPGSDDNTDQPGESDSNDGGFIEDPDGGGPNNECDIWTQDCPEGEKCMPWANDGGGSWNATRCSPLDPNPGQPGDECSVEGSGVSGIDDCDLSAMCWDVDPETNLGVCVGFCEGDENNPLCSDPDTGCSTSNEGVLILCLPFCDPLLQDCGEGGACYPEAAGFFCSPDASGPDLGMYGDPCEFLNVCDPGLWCADAETVPGCEGSIGCCSAFCDGGDPDADMNCPGFAEGQTCVPWWAEGDAPPGEEDFAVCVIEQ